MSLLLFVCYYHIFLYVLTCTNAEERINLSELFLQTLRLTFWSIILQYIRHFVVTLTTQRRVDEQLFLERDS